jgi:hypothetical protein
MLLDGDPLTTIYTSCCSAQCARQNHAPHTHRWPAILWCGSDVVVVVLVQQHGQVREAPMVVRDRCAQEFVPAECPPAAHSLPEPRVIPRA